MLLFLVIYIVAIVWGVKFRMKPTQEYLDFDHTQAVKGIFILMVLFSHFNGQVTFTRQMDLGYQEIISFFGQTMVTMFLFYSGYGIMESIKKKGKNYINGIPQKRIFPTLIRFDCAVVIYAVLTLLLGQRFPWQYYPLALTGWESVGNSNWYIFDILVLYILTYAIFKMFYGKKEGRIRLSACIMLFLMAGGVVFLTWYYLKPTWWYDTVFCYMIGMFYSIYRPKIEKIVNKNCITWLIFLVITWGTFLFFKMNQINIWFIMARNIAFCIAVTVLTMRVAFKNKVLIWCGKHLFEIYILQRIPMILLKAFGLDQWNVYLYFAGCAGITLALIYPFKWLTDRLVTAINVVLFKGAQKKLKERNAHAQ